MKKFSFYILQKDFNTGKMIPYNVMTSLYGTILTGKNTLKKDWLENWKVKDKKSLRNFVRGHFHWLYAGQCEWEFITRDWPTENPEKDLKVCGFDQLEPNIDLIVDLLWEQLKDKINEKV